MNTELAFYLTDLRSVEEVVKEFKYESVNQAIEAIIATGAKTSDYGSNWYLEPEPNNREEYPVKVQDNGNTAVVESPRSSRIKSLDDLLLASNINAKEWSVENFKTNSWEVGYRDKDSGEMKVETLYQTKAFLIRNVAVHTEFPPIHPVRFEFNVNTSAKSAKSERKYHTALIIPDSQNGYRRDMRTGMLDPFHDRRAWDICFQLADKLQPECIVLLGDMLDLCDWSQKYLVSPDCQFTTQAALDELGFTLAFLKNISPNSQVDYILGNHEKRMETALLSNLSAAYGIREANKPNSLPVMSIPYLLGLESLGINWTREFPDGEIWLNQELKICHTDGLRGGGSGATGRSVLRNATHSVIYGHIHNHELLTRTVFTQNQIITRVAGSPGTIARLDGKVPANKANNDWQQGVFIVHYDPDGVEFNIESLLINDGKTIFRGQEIVGDFPIEELRQSTQCAFY